MSELMIENIKLTEEVLIDIIKGKKLSLYIDNKYQINIIPPKYGVTLTYEEWRELLSEFMPTSSKSFELLNKIENKFR